MRCVKGFQNGRTPESSSHSPFLYPGMFNSNERSVSPDPDVVLEADDGKVKAGALDVKATGTDYDRARRSSLAS